MRRSTVFALLVAVGLFASLLAAPRAGAIDAIPPNGAVPGSLCKPVAMQYPYTPPGAGVSTTGLGSTAPAYYEFGGTTGAFAGQPAKGIMIVIHGGGWYVVGKEAVAQARWDADRWRARGWQTVNIDYRGCSQSVNDVFSFMNLIRQVRPTARICVSGMSAGGHLALLLASIRKDLSCVIAMAGPSDLVSLPQQQAFDPKLGTFTSTNPIGVFNLAVAALGASPSPLVFSSPIRYVGNIKAHVLLGSATSDPIVPTVQNTNYAAALKAAQPNAYVDVALIPDGDQPFVHSGVSQAGMNDFVAREDALVASLTS